MSKYNICGADNNEIEFTGCELSDINEGRLLSANSEFLAMLSKKQNEIIIVNSSKSVKINPDLPHFTHTQNSKILDIEFSPFNTNILASGNEDKTVTLWEIPEGGLTKNISKSKLNYNKHSNKVSTINFNPISSDVICSSSLKNIHVWNLQKNETYIELQADDNPNSILWNPKGDLIGVTAKNKYINIFEPKNNIKVTKQKVTEYYSSPFTWLNDDTFVTVSWDKEGKGRMLKLWDIKNIEKEISSIKIDDSKEQPNIFVNRELKLIYSFGRREKFINVYGYNADLNYLSTFNSQEQNECSAMLDRIKLDKNKFEINRFARYAKKNKIYYVKFFLKNKSNDFDYEEFLNQSSIQKTPISFEQWINEQKNNNQINNNSNTDTNNNTNNTDKEKILSLSENTTPNNDNIIHTKMNGSVKIDEIKKNLDEIERINNEKYNELQKKFEVLENSNSELKKLYEEKEQNYKNMEEKYKKKEKELEEINKKFIEIKNEYNKINSEYNKEKEDKTNLEIRCEDMSKKIIELEEYKNQVEILKDNIKKIEEDKSELEKNKNQQENKYNKLNKDYEESKNKNNELEKQINDLNVKNSDITKKYEEKEHCYNEINKENEELKNKIKEYENNNIELKNNYEINDKSLEIKNKNDNDNEDKNVVNNLISENNKEIENIIKEKDTKIKELKNKLKEAVVKKENIIKEQKKEIQECKSKIEILEKENNDYKTKINEYQNKTEQERYELKIKEMEKNLKEKYENLLNIELKEIKEALKEKLFEKAEIINEEYKTQYKTKEDERDKKFNEMSEVIIRKSNLSLNNNNINNCEFSLLNSLNNDIKFENNDLSWFINKNEEINKNNNNHLNNLNKGKKNENININAINNNIVNIQDNYFNNNYQQEQHININKNGINNENNINIKKFININKIEEQQEQEIEYSYECTNKQFLSEYISSGTNEVSIVVELKNNGDKPWPKDKTKLKYDKKSYNIGEDIILKPQNPGQQEKYEILIKNLEKCFIGEIKFYLCFCVNEKNFGEKLSLNVVIIDKNVINDELSKYNDKIKEFRNSYGLDDKEFSDLKILYILKKYNFDSYKAFAYIFQ